MSRFLVVGDEAAPTRLAPARWRRQRRRHRMWPRGWRRRGPNTQRRRRRWRQPLALLVDLLLLHLLGRASRLVGRAAAPLGTCAAPSDDEVGRPWRRLHRLQRVPGRRDEGGHAADGALRPSERVDIGSALRGGDDGSGGRCRAVQRGARGGCRSTCPTRWPMMRSCPLAINSTPLHQQQWKERANKSKVTIADW